MVRFAAPVSALLAVFAGLPAAATLALPATALAQQETGGGLPHDGGAPTSRPPAAMPEDAAPPPPAPAPDSDADAGPDLPEPAANQIALTPAMVEQFLKSWPDIAALGDKLADEFGVDEDAADPAAAFTIWARRPQAAERIGAVLRQHGYSGLDEWSRVTNSVLVAYDYDDSLTDPAQIADAVREIESTPGMSREEKDGLIAQVHQQAEQAAANKPLPGNSAVVEPFRDRIGAAINGEPLPEGDPLQ